MRLITTTMLLITLIAVVGAASAATILTARLVDLLKTRHEALWNQLGRPTFLTAIIQVSNYGPHPFREWINTRGYEATNDAATVRVAGQLRAAGRILFWSVLSLAVLFTGVKFLLRGRI